MCVCDARIVSAILDQSSLGFSRNLSANATLNSLQETAEHLHGVPEAAVLRNSLHEAADAHVCTVEDLRNVAEILRKTPTGRLQRSTMCFWYYAALPSAHSTAMPASVECTLLRRGTTGAICVHVHCCPRKEPPPASGDWARRAALRCLGARMVLDSWS